MDGVSSIQIKTLQLLPGARYGLKQKTARVELAYYGAIADLAGFDSALAKLLEELAPDAAKPLLRSLAASEEQGTQDPLPGLARAYLRHLGGKHGDPLPPGVSLDESASKTLLGPTETKEKIVLLAAATAAPVENLPIAVLGHVSINFVVKLSHASELVYLTVAKP